MLQNPAPDSRRGIRKVYFWVRGAGWAESVRYFVVASKGGAANNIFANQKRRRHEWVLGLGTALYKG